MANGFLADLFSPPGVQEQLAGNAAVPVIEQKKREISSILGGRDLAAASGQQASAELAGDFAGGAPAPTPQLQPRRAALPVVGQSTTTRTAPLSGEEAAFQLSELSKIKENREKSIHETAAKREIILAKQAELQQSFSEETQRLRDSLGARGAAFAKRFEQAQGEFSAIRADLNKAKVDPSRLMKSMPTWARALTVMTTALDRLNRRPRAARIINQAIERDIRTQRQNIVLQLQKAEVSDRQRRFAFRQWMGVEDQQRSVATRLAQMQFAQVAIEGKRLETKVAAVDGMFALKEGLLDARKQLAIQSRAQSTTTTQRARPAGGPGKLEFTKDERGSITGAGEFADSIGTLLEGLSKGEEAVGGRRAAALISTAPGLASIGGRLAGGSAGERVQKLSKATNFGSRVALSLTKALSGATATDAERETNARNLPQPGGSDAAKAQAVRQQVSDMRSKILERARLAAIEGRHGEAAAQAQAARRVTVLSERAISKWLPGANAATTPTESAAAKRFGASAQ